MLLLTTEILFYIEKLKIDSGIGIVSICNNFWVFRFFRRRYHFFFVLEDFFLYFSIFRDVFRPT